MCFKFTRFFLHTDNSTFLFYLLFLLQLQSCVASFSKIDKKLLFRVKIRTYQVGRPITTQMEKAVYGAKNGKINLGKIWDQKMQRYSSVKIFHWQIKINMWIKTWERTHHSQFKWKKTHIQVKQNGNSSETFQISFSLPFL